MANILTTQTIRTYKSFHTDVTHNKPTLFNCKPWVFEAFLINMFIQGASIAFVSWGWVTQKSNYVTININWDIMTYLIIVVIPITVNKYQHDLVIMKRTGVSFTKWKYVNNVTWVTSINMQWWTVTHHVPTVSLYEQPAVYWCTKWTAESLVT